MHVKQVELIFYHVIDKQLDLVLCKKVSGNIEHHSPPRKSWVIGDFHRWYGPAFLLHRFFAFNLLRHQLDKGLKTVKNAGGLVCLYGNTFGRNFQPVSFVTYSRIIYKRY